MEQQFILSALHDFDSVEKRPLIPALQTRTSSATFGCMDPVQVTQMAKHIDTVYVSGWQCSATASSSNEPSPDLADYPMVCHDFFPTLRKQVAS